MFDNHYAAIKLDFMSKTISYGDSLELVLNDRDRRGFERFASKLDFRFSPATQTLPHEHQDDGYSCLDVTVNTIERGLFTNTRPWAKETKSLERVEWALLLATAIGSPYCLVIFFSVFNLPVLVSYRVLSYSRLTLVYPRTISRPGMMDGESVVYPRVPSTTTRMTTPSTVVRAMMVKIVMMMGTMMMAGMTMGIIDTVNHPRLLRLSLGIQDPTSGQTPQTSRC